MIKRLIDILFSLIFIIVLSPVLLIIIIVIVADSKSPVIFKQARVGKNNFDFEIWKFRTMFVDSEKTGQLTIGGRDERITKAGYILRKYKLDELPQLFNVLIGDMSLVGPRPEVRKYVAMYNDTQKNVLSIKPGITDFASIQFSNENEILAGSSNPEKTYIEEIMPAKLLLNLNYISQQSLSTDLKIIWLTVKKILS